LQRTDSASEDPSSESEDRPHRHRLLRPPVGRGLVRVRALRADRRAINSAGRISSSTRSRPSTRATDVPGRLPPRPTADAASAGSWPAPPARTCCGCSTKGRHRGCPGARRRGGPPTAAGRCLPSHMPQNTNATWHNSNVVGWWPRCKAPDCPDRFMEETNEDVRRHFRPRTPRCHAGWDAVRARSSAPSVLPWRAGRCCPCDRLLLPKISPAQTEGEGEPKPRLDAQHRDDRRRVQNDSWAGSRIFVGRSQLIIGHARRFRAQK